jgi:predicted dehydrogenase
MDTVVEAKKDTLRVGFIGTGWIGRNRMEALLQEQFIKPVAILDIDNEQACKALEIIPGAFRCTSIEEMVSTDIDAVVIATPNALHEEHAMFALERNCAVFCQKPLGRNANECIRIIDYAQKQNLRLGIDMSYRYLEGIQIGRSIIEDGLIGDIFNVECCFHNAYGPDKAWFYNPVLSGGGCLIDLGVHCIDLAMWVLGFPAVQNVSGFLYEKGKRVFKNKQLCAEDFADAIIELESGVVIRTVCSWKVSAGCDAVIKWVFYGSKGALCVGNCNGSFYDFITEQYNGTSCKVLKRESTEWSHKAIREWAKKTYENKQFDASVKEHVIVSKIMDSIYDHE